MNTLRDDYALLSCGALGLAQLQTPSSSNWRWIARRSISNSRRALRDLKSFNEALNHERRSAAVSIERIAA
jgi:hypothetical protein